MLGIEGVLQRVGEGVEGQHQDQHQHSRCTDLPEEVVDDKQQKPEEVIDDKQQEPEEVIDDKQQKPEEILDLVYAFESDCDSDSESESESEIIKIARKVMRKSKKQDTKPDVIKTMEEKKTNIELTTDEYGNIVHEETGIAFSHDEEEIDGVKCRCAIGYRLKSGHIKELTEEKLEVCNQYGFRFLAPQNLYM